MNQLQILHAEDKPQKMNRGPEIPKLMEGLCISLKKRRVIPPPKQFRCIYHKNKSNAGKYIPVPCTVSYMSCKKLYISTESKKSINEIPSIPTDFDRQASLGCGYRQFQVYGGKKNAKSGKNPWGFKVDR